MSSGIYNGGRHFGFLEERASCSVPAFVTPSIYAPAFHTLLKSNVLLYASPSHTTRLAACYVVAWLFGWWDRLGGHFLNGRLETLYLYTKREENVVW